MSELKPHELLAAIRERVTPATHEYLCGVCDSIEQELIGIAQRDGIEAAVAEAEALAAPEITDADKAALTAWANDTSGQSAAEALGAQELERLERLGAVQIERPVDANTGLPYGVESWRVTIAPGVLDED